jgi:hypothetical protein
MDLRRETGKYRVPLWILNSQRRVADQKSDPLIGIFIDNDFHYLLGSGRDFVIGDKSRMAHEL